MWEDVSQDESTAHVVEDLIPGLTYIFRVAAINEIGIGPYSKPSAPVVLVTDTTLDGDSPAMDVRLKNTAFDLEYELGEELGRWVNKTNAVLRTSQLSARWTATVGI